MGFDKKIQYSDCAIIIPALNEEKGLQKVLTELPFPNSSVIVVDNGSTDNTRQIGLDQGCFVITEPRKGYGFACLAGIKYIKSQNIKPKYVLFLDADGADTPSDILKIVDYKKKSRVPSLLMGSRVKYMEPGSMTIHSIVANKILSNLINVLYRSKITDMGPLRIIDYKLLVAIDMKDTGYGWSSEMIVKTLKMGYRVHEIDVRYRRRVGTSKISGSFITSMKAAVWLTVHIFRHFIAR